MRLIGISGKAGSGKDTVADIILQQYPGFKRAMAKPIKDAFEAVFGFDPDSISRQEKETPFMGFHFSPRRAMQTLGTEWGRELDENVWLRLAHRHYNSVFRKSGYLVIPDIRFKNEAAWLRAQGGLLIHVERPDVKDVEKHASELGTGIPPDITIHNTGSIIDLTLAVTKALDNAGQKQ